MRVIHVITRLIVGGAQENTVASVLGFVNHSGWETQLISGPAKGKEGSLESKFERIPDRLTLLPELVRPIHPWKDWLARRRLAQIFRAQRPDIVHTHSGKAGFLGRLAAARANIIHTIHGPSFGPFQGALANALFRSAEQRAGKLTSHFVVVANAMSRQYLAAGIGQPSQYTKIASGFQIEPFLAATRDPALRRKWGIAPADIVVGKVARLFKLKGHDDLFRIAPELIRVRPQIKFLLVGDGAWRERFEQSARELRLEKHFIFTGLVPPEEVPQLIGMMDILVHLSLREGLPRALPQALAAARPVIAYDCDGANEVCLDNETGFLLQPGDLKGLVDRLTRLADDVELREQFGRRGQLLVRDQFAVERMVNDLEALYLRLAAEKGIQPK